MRFILLLLCTVTAQAAPLKTDYSMGNYGYKPGSPMNLEKLMSVIAPARDVPQALALFKKAAPEYFENFVLVYRSQSLQESSFQAPRVLLFDPSGEMVVTFNGDPKHRGFQKLELMQFRGDTLKFEFREIDFTPTGPKASEANPKTCLQCHQSATRAGVDPRPNWEPYNVWPGAYGSDSGRLWPRSKYEADKLRGDDRIMAEEQPREQEEIRKFWFESRPADPRYALLEVPQKALKAKGEVDFDEIAHQSVSFTDILSNLSLRRMVRLAQTDNPEAYARVRHSLVHLYRCENLAMSDEIRVDLARRVNAQGIFRVPTAKVESASYGYGGPTEDGRGGDDNYVIVRPEPRFQHTFSEQLTMLFESQGVSTLDWSTDFGTRGRFAFVERFGRPSNLRVMGFLAEQQEGELGKLSCDELKPLALAESEKFAAWLANFRTPADQIRPASDPTQLLSRCISCHVEASSSGAPKIPFDQPDSLSRMLKYDRVSNGRTFWEETQYRLSDHARLTDQMPPSLRRPEPEDRRALLKYFEELRQR